MLSYPITANNIHCFLLSAITPLVIDAKAVATNPTDKNAHKKLRESTRKVLWVSKRAGEIICCFQMMSSFKWLLLKRTAQPSIMRGLLAL